MRYECRGPDRCSAAASCGPSAATDGVSLIKAAERLVKGGRPALKELKCARLTLLEFGAGRGEVEAICNVVVHCRDVSAASLGSTVAARRLVWKVRRISKRGRCQKLDVLGVAGPVLGGGGVSGAVRSLEGRRVSEATWLPTTRQKERLVAAGFSEPGLSGVINPERALRVVDAWRSRHGLMADERLAMLKAARRATSLRPCHFGHGPCCPRSPRRRA